MNNLSFSTVLGSMGPVVYLLVLSDLILKGVALFKSGQRNQKVWFVALLFVNSLGILPIIYLVLNKDIGSTKTSVVSKKSVTTKSKKSRK